eukprot:scaffold293861_cov28-Tisochrysis_lutea.AAC.10
MSRAQGGLCRHRDRKIGICRRCQPPHSRPSSCRAMRLPSHCQRFRDRTARALQCGTIHMRLDVRGLASLARAKGGGNESFLHAQAVHSHRGPRRRLGHQH